VPNTVRTTLTRPFGELAPSQFEGVVRQVMGSLAAVQWEIRPDPIGHLGSDAGQDIRATELFIGRTGKVSRRQWLAQVKRVQRIQPADLAKIVNKAIPAGSRAPHTFVVAVPCDATARSFDTFKAAAKKRGVKRADLWTREKMNDFLNEAKNARIASFYFGDGSAIQGTVPLPLALDRSAGRDVPLLSRDDEVRELKAQVGDVVIVGPAGTGKSRLAAEAQGVRFVSLQSNAEGVAESLRLDQPSHVVIDDAGLDLGRLEMLLEFRREHAFGIVATTWRETLRDVLALLPGAAVIETRPLERNEMDALLLAVGIGNYYLRGWILDLAEGRPGWAVGLADLAKRGQITSVLSGRGLIDQIGPYLRRLAPSGSEEIFTLLGILAAIDAVDLDRDMETIDVFLRIDVLKRREHLRAAAAVGILDITKDRLRVAPLALRGALIAEVFYDEGPAFPIAAVIRAWPGRRAQIIHGVILAAAAGSAGARRDVDALVPDVIELVAQGSVPALQEFTALDEDGARRALRQTAHLPAGDWARQRVLEISTQRFVLPEALLVLLDSAVGDDRPEHPNPNHPIRMLGELGSRVDPHGRTSFELRHRVLAAADAWLDYDSSPSRQLVWARVVVHLLDPTAEGTFPTTASYMTIQFASAIERPENIRSIKDDLWPPIRDRLGRLDTAALALLIEPVRELASVERGHAPGHGPPPTPDQRVAAGEVLAAVLPALNAVAASRPGLQLALHRLRRQFHVGPRQDLDPEFRLLAMGWQSMRASRNSGHVGHAIDRLVDHWLTEPPNEVMPRLARWAKAAASAGLDLEPVGRMAFDRYGRRATDADALVAAGMAADLGHEIEPVMRHALGRATKVPTWFPGALAGPLRLSTLSAALDPGANAESAAMAVASLTTAEARFVETALLRHGGAGHGAVSRALLRHRNPEVRGAASLGFGLGWPGRSEGLPEGWSDDWKRAFLDAPLGQHGSNYDLATTLTHLVAHDPELVEQWLAMQLRKRATLWRLGFEDKLDLALLPRDVRDRLLRRAAGGRTRRLLRRLAGLLPQPLRARMLRRFSTENRHQLLQLLLGDDREWAADLLFRGVVTVGDIHMALANGNHDGLAPAEALAWAPVLLAHGASAVSIRFLTDLGHMGPESARYAELRAGFETVPPSVDPAVERVRQEAISDLAGLERKALEEEQRERVTGRIA
jgi:hypothetical protein